MTTAELLIAVDDAVAAAFPNRAADLLGVVRRWIWFSVAMEPPPPEDAEAAVLPAEHVMRCVWCARGGYWARTIVYTDPPRRGEVRWHRRVVDVGLPPPRAVLCGACAVLMAQVAVERVPAPDQVLADLSRALAGSEDGARASEELGRRAGAARVPVRTLGRHCDLCGAHSETGCVGRDPLFLCDDCLLSARATVLAPPPDPPLDAT